MFPTLPLPYVHTAVHNRESEGIRPDARTRAPWQPLPAFAYARTARLTRRCATASASPSNLPIVRRPQRRDPVGKTARPRRPGRGRTRARRPTRLVAGHDHADAVAAPVRRPPQRRRVRTRRRTARAALARPGEQGTLTVGDINRHTGAVSITNAWKWANGPAEAGRPEIRARGIRTTFVPLETVARLDRDASEHLFLSHTGRPVTSIRFWDEGWAPMMVRLRALAAGDSTPFTGRRSWEGLSYHVLRERYGHLAKAAGVQDG